MGLIKMNGVNYWGSAYGQGIIAPMIYSDEEKEVGVWRDGKPLYERVVQINSLPADTNTTAYPHGISDIDTICDYDFIIHWSNGNTAKADRIQMFSGTFQANGAIAVFINDTNISISCGQDRSALSGDCIIRYTKTTDTAGSGTYTPSGALAVHYSTNEQVIGTWIDGKPLYQRTISFDNVAVANDVQINHNISNLKMAVNTQCVMYDSSTGISFDFSVNGDVNSQGMVIGIRVYPTSLWFRGTQSFSASANRTWYVTLKYTKTTD